MLLPVRLETPVRTKYGTAAAVPNALYALKGPTLLSASGAVGGASMFVGTAYSRHSYSGEKATTEPFFAQVQSPLQQTPTHQYCPETSASNSNLTDVEDCSLHLNVQDATPASRQGPVAARDT